MKKVIWMAAVAAGLVGCSGDEPNDEQVKNDEKEAVVTFRVDVTDGGGDAGGAAARITRGTPVASSEMTDLWIYDYVGGEMKQGTHQRNTDSGFGTVSMSIPLGQHTFYFVASMGDEPNEETDGVITWAKTKDTFWGKAELNLTNGTTANVDVELQRVVTKLAVNVTDVVPADIATLTITPQTWFYGLDYTTGEPTGAQDGVERTVSVPASFVGTTDLAMSIMGFAGVSGFETGFSVSARNASNVTIGQATVAAAPFVQNRTTRFSGPLFHANEGITITLADEWLDDYTATW